MTNYSTEEKRARKAFFKLHGKEIQAKNKAWEKLVTSEVYIDREGFPNHAVRISQLETQFMSQLMVQGWIPANAVYFTPNEPLYFIRIDHVVYTEGELKSGKKYLHVSRENGSWYARYDQVVWDPSRIVDSRVVNYPAYIPIHLFMPTGRIRSDV